MHRRLDDSGDHRVASVWMIFATRINRDSVRSRDEWTAMRWQSQKGSSKSGGFRLHLFAQLIQDYSFVGKEFDALICIGRNFLIIR